VGYRFEGADGLTDAQLKVMQALIAGGPSSPSQLLQSGGLGIGPAMLHRHLSKLVQLNLIQKVGFAPKVYYQVLTKQ
jgi:DNA-binding HxlR family transcriptional regulator